MSGEVLIFILILILSGVESQRTEEKVVEIGEPFSFDCKSDDSVYFARRLGDWSQIQENDSKHPYLQFNFNSLPNENIQRISSDSVQSQHSGYYACGQARSINRIYHLILAEVQSFYWTYICHGPAGSCQRTDDENDQTLSTFEVADRTNVDLFCCASITGYKNFNLNMNQIGEIRGQIDVRRKQELDGSSVICANQHTRLTRTSIRNNQQTLTCELITDGRSSSSLASVVVVKDAMEVDPDADPPYGYTPPPRDGSNEGGYFNPQGPSNRGRLTTGRKIAILIGSSLGGLLLLGLLFGLIFLICRKKQASKSTHSSPAKSYEYFAAQTYVDRNLGRKISKDEDEEEHIYIEPTPLYENTPTTFRL